MPDYLNNSISSIKTRYIFYFTLPESSLKTDYFALYDRYFRYKKCPKSIFRKFLNTYLCKQ